jgi:diguanylate cyclase (GGDEF)-like protein
MGSTAHRIAPTPPHPRVLGWVGNAALAMGGSNQMIFIITALFVGQDAILGQGSAAVPLLIVGVLLGWAAAPAWTELVLMWPNRVGGISAACAEAFRPYNPVLASLTGTCYWWGWIPTCGLTALLSASALQHWYFPGLPVELVAISILTVFTVVALCGIKWVARLAIPIATISASLAFLSAFVPMFSGTVDWHQALADDGLLPRFLSLRLKSTDCPWAATLLTAGSATIFLLAGDPIWMIAAANFTYLIGICMPNICRVASAPRHARCTPAILGFQQFGLPTVLFGLALAYSGAGLYAWRVMEDRRRLGLPMIAKTLHAKLTGAMLFVLVLDGIAYLMAVNTVSDGHIVLVTVLEDIFVAVALLTISVGLVLPGMITYSAQEVSAAAKRLTWGTLRDFSIAMRALGRGDLDAAHASVNIVPVRPNSHDELGEMADSFNLLQEQVRDAALGLDEARDNMRIARAELLARHAQITHLAHHDPLTDLPNRTLLAAKLAGVLEHAKARGESFALLTIDLDHFKEANDVFGHTTGDELLCAISRRLAIAADGDFLARVGGDEFTLVCSSSHQPKSAKRLASRILQAIADPFEVQGQIIPIGLSIGAAVYPHDGTDAVTLLANADAALYRAKEHGRKTVRFFDPDLDRRLRDRFALQIDLRSALGRKELLLRYQPQAKIDGTVFGFEALARWQHPTRGLVPPTDFITLAEQNGMIVEIGAWTLKEACREAASWTGPLQISVNLSPVQFRYGDLAGLVHIILLETGLSPGRLELEITEGVMFDDPARALSILRRLKGLGVKIAMDDFGTGYASMSSLRSFPFDKIKIDRSFVSGLETNPQSAAIVRSIIGLGEALKVPVIAEGVETEGERSILWMEGCTEIQGFLIGHPLPISAYASITHGVADLPQAAQVG